MEKSCCAFNCSLEPRFLAITKNWANTNLERSYPTPRNCVPVVWFEGVDRFIRRGWGVNINRLNFFFFGNINIMLGVVCNSFFFFVFFLFRQTPIYYTNIRRAWEKKKKKKKSKIKLHKSCPFNVMLSLMADAVQVVAMTRPCNFLLWGLCYTMVQLLQNFQALGASQNPAFYSFFSCSVLNCIC